MTISTTNGDAPNSPEASTYSAYIKEELRRYDEHLQDVRGLSAGTRKDRLRIIGLLLEGKFKHREVVFARMQPDDIRQFFPRDWHSARRPPMHHNMQRPYGVTCVTAPPAVTRWPSLPPLSRLLSTGNWHRCRVRSNRMRLSVCWNHSLPSTAGQSEATPSSAAHWTWGCDRVKSPT